MSQSGPLREYPRSIPSMVKQFVRDADVAYGRSVVGLSDPALAALRPHSFPGNVRELRNIIEQGVLMAEGSHIQVGDLPAYLRGLVPAPPMPGSLAGAQPGTLAPSMPSAGVLPRPRATPPPTVDPSELNFEGTDWGYKSLKEDILRRFEERYLDALLGTTGGNVTRAAELAGIHRVNLHRMLKRRDEGRGDS